MLIWLLLVGAITAEQNDNRRLKIERNLSTEIFADYKKYVAPNMSRFAVNLPADYWNDGDESEDATAYSATTDPTSNLTSDAASTDLVGNTTTSDPAVETTEDPWYWHEHYDWQPAAMIVGLQLGKVVILNVNEREGSVSVLVNGLVNWSDPRLSWDESEHDQIDEMLVRCSDIWLPFFRPCRSQTPIPFLSEASSALIDSYGIVTAFFTQIVTYTCAMEFDNFPFDEQQCSLCFALEGNRYGANFNVGPVDTVWLNGSSEWTFVSGLNETRPEKSKTEPAVLGARIVEVFFNFTIARNPEFWRALVITPVSLITFITLVGIFFTKKETVVESTTTLGLTAITSLMLVVTILAENVAKTNRVPGVGWMSVAEIIVICIAVILRIALDRIRAALLRQWEGKPEHRRGRKLTLAVSSTAHRIACCVLFSCCCGGVVLAKTLPWRG